MAVSKRLRYEILRRDGFRCRYCGAEPDERELTVDHVHPVALGGAEEPSNLVCCCRDCNAGKSSTVPDSPIVEGVADDALRWAQAMKEAARVARSRRRPITTAIKAVGAEWSGWTGYLGDPFPLPPDWKQSVENFLVAGLTKADLLELIPVAMNSKAYDNKKWNYFCGCCWKRVSERQEIARALIEAGEEGEE